MTFCGSIISLFFSSLASVHGSKLVRGISISLSGFSLELFM